MFLILFAPLSKNTILAFLHVVRATIHLNKPHSIRLAAATINLVIYPMVRQWLSLLFLFVLLSLRFENSTADDYAHNVVLRSPDANSPSVAPRYPR